MARDIDDESYLLEVDSNPYINAFYLYLLLEHIGECTVNQLACGLYLFRFTNITSGLLDNRKRKVFLAKLPEWEKKNLDTLLTPYLVEKFNSRFLAGLRELLMRGVVEIKGETVKKSTNTIRILDVERRLVHKAKYVSDLIINNPYDFLETKIDEIVGDERWKNQYL